jgi:hypothetical protein
VHHVPASQNHKLATPTRATQTHILGLARFSPLGGLQLGKLKRDEPEFSDGKKTATFKHCEFQVADEMIYKSNAPQFFVDDIPPEDQEKQ